MINHINRSAIIIAPKQAFFDMVAKLSGEPSADKVLSPFTDDEATIYLIQEADLEMTDAKERLASCYKEIFFEELEGWFTDESRWPGDVSWEQFEAWFHISWQSEVMDTLDEEIEYE
jgi:hypothetical protein